MHRSIELAVPTAASDPLVAALKAIEGVVGLSRHESASLVPSGDVITVHVLNQAADDVLRAAARICGEGDFMVVSTEVASISSERRQHEINNDVDEAIWEELETGLRHQGRLTANFLILMALGGVIGAAATLAEPEVAMIAYVASAIITPGFEPVAKLPLGMVLRSGNVMMAGLKSALAGYVVLAGAAALTWLILSRVGVEASAFLDGVALKHTLEPTPDIYAVSLAGAFAGAIILASYRRSVIAGALVAMRLIEAAAVAGVALGMGRTDIAVQGLQRLGIDIGFVIIAGLIVFGLKQMIVHRRAPLR